MPHDSDVKWQPPENELQRVDEDTRDLIVAYSSKVTSTEIASMLSTKQNNAGRIVRMDKRRVGCILTSMKRRRKERDYDYHATLNSAASDDDDFDSEDAKMLLDEQELCQNKALSDCIPVSAKLIQANQCVLPSQPSNSIASAGNIAISLTANQLAHLSNSLARSNKPVPNVSLSASRFLQPNPFVSPVSVSAGLPNPTEHDIIVMQDGNPIEIITLPRSQNNQDGKDNLVKQGTGTAPAPNDLMVSPNLPSSSSSAFYSNLNSCLTPGLPANVVSPINDTPDSFSMDLTHKLAVQDIPNLSNLGDIGALLQAACQHND